MPRKDIYKDAVPFKRQGDVPKDVPLAAKTFGVRLPADIDTAIRALPEPTSWVRQVLIQAAKVELLGESPAPGAGSPAANSGAEPAPAQLDTAELVQLVDELLAIPRLPKLAKENLLKLRERLTPP